jgi:hypothetical protein
VALLGVESRHHIIDDVVFKPKDIGKLSVKDHKRERCEYYG